MDFVLRFKAAIPSDRYIIVIGVTLFILGSAAIITTIHSNPSVNSVQTTGSVATSTSAQSQTSTHTQIQPTTPVATTTTIIPAGDTIQLSSSLGTTSEVYFTDTFQDSVRVSGSFSSSYSASLYIVTASQFNSGEWVLQYVTMFAAFNGQGAPTSVDWNLQPGQYYFIIVNAMPIQSTFTTSDGIVAVPIV